MFVPKTRGSAQTDSRVAPDSQTGPARKDAGLRQKRSSPTAKPGTSGQAQPVQTRRAIQPCQRPRVNSGSSKPTARPSDMKNHSENPPSATSRIRKPAPATTSNVVTSKGSTAAPSVAEVEPESVRSSDVAEEKPLVSSGDPVVLPIESPDFHATDGLSNSSQYSKNKEVTFSKTISESSERKATEPFNTALAPIYARSQTQQSTSMDIKAIMNHLLKVGLDDEEEVGTDPVEMDTEGPAYSQSSATSSTKTMPQRDNDSEINSQVQGHRSKTNAAPVYSFAQFRDSGRRPVQFDNSEVDEVQIGTVSPRYDVEMGNNDFPTLSTAVDRFNNTKPTSRPQLQNFNSTSNPFSDPSVGQNVTMKSGGINPRDKLEAMERDVEMRKEALRKGIRVDIDIEFCLVILAISYSRHCR